MSFRTAFLAASLASLGALTAQTIQPPFTGIYAFTDLGQVTGVPTPYGGVVFKAGDPSRVLIGGTANAAGGAIYEAAVLRDASGHITGFSGTATLFATAPNIDGGLQYGPGGVLFFTGYPSNVLGQIKPGSTAPDRSIVLSTIGVTGSVGALSFVPAGFPQAGELKVASYSTNTWYGLSLTPDGSGTFTAALANGPVPVQGGPEGILYVPPGSAVFPNYQYLLLTEYGAGTISAMQVDGSGNPLSATRVPFMTGLGGAEGATIDPVTGDLVFSTFGGGSRVITVQGFGVCGSFTNYGTGIVGTNGAPHIGGGGCAGRGQIADLAVSNGLANAPGLLAAGFNSASLPALGGSLLLQPYSTTFHQLDGAGQWTLHAGLPINPVLSGLNVFFQSFYLDAVAPQGVSATEGVQMIVR